MATRSRSKSSDRSLKATIMETDDVSREYIDGNSNSNDSKDDNWSQTVAKELKSLSFANPGKFMDNFDPERSAREMRKMNRRIYRENIKKNQVYDELGLYLENSNDICDCLSMNCPGCHFPCTKCGSEKCGQECRCCRRYIFESIEIEGTKTVVQFPEEITPSFT
ncbi:ARL14 effector protein-like [Mytilus californianus]|nr:ARL14 effector protein-like [Mytilus californianus]